MSHIKDITKPNFLLIKSSGSSNGSPLFLLVHFPARRLNTEEERMEHNGEERRREGHEETRIKGKEKVKKIKHDAKR